MGGMDAPMTISRHATLVASVFSLLLLCVQCGEAQMFGSRVFVARPLQQSPRQSHWQPAPRAAPRRAPTYEEYYQYMNSHFPKYYGGFHASYFQSIGTTPGDIGLRGNGIFPTPW